MRLAPLKAVLLLVLAGVAQAGETDARDWLERMTRAMSEMSYQGTFVYVRDNAMETMRITHVSDADGVRERLYSVSGPHREVIRDGKGVRCALQDADADVEDAVVTDAYFPELPLALIDREASGYRLETGGETRIAGHMARRVSISPADDFRYGYHFWLEKDTGLLLKWVLFDTGKKPLAKLVFTDLVFGPAVDTGELEPKGADGDFIEMKTFGREGWKESVAVPRWQPKTLPPGFHLASHSNKTSVEGVYEHMVYSDGLAAVSVYVERNPGDDIEPGVRRLGTNNAYTRKQGELQITAIGEVPVVTVKSIANEMAPAVSPQ